MHLKNGIVYNITVTEEVLLVTEEVLLVTEEGGSCHGGGGFLSRRRGVLVTEEVLLVVEDKVCFFCLSPCAGCKNPTGWMM